MQNLHCRMGTQVEMLAQVDVSKSSSSQQTKQVIVAELLALTPDVIRHTILLPGAIQSNMGTMRGCTTQSACFQVTNASFVYCRGYTSILPQS